MSDIVFEGRGDERVDIVVGVMVVVVYAYARGLVNCDLAFQRY